MDVAHHAINFRRSAAKLNATFRGASPDIDELLSIMFGPFEWKPVRQSERNADDALVLFYQTIRQVTKQNALTFSIVANDIDASTAVTS